jgi:hypothetical protein
MKTIFNIFFGLFLLYTVPAFTQLSTIMPYDTSTKKIIYSEVVKMDTSINPQTIYQAAKGWFLSDITKFNKAGSTKGSDVTDAFFTGNKSTMVTNDLKHKVDQPLTSDDPQGRVLIGRGMYKYFGSSLGMIRSVYINFSIKIQVKKGRYKYEITNFATAHYNPYTGKSCTYGSFSDKGNCQSSGPMENLIFCDSGITNAIEKMFNSTDQYIQWLTSDLKNYVSEHLEPENW